MSKIPAPNYTQSPNILFDEIFKTLKEGELRIILVLMRQTFGWHKSFDRISLGQLADKTGMERSSVARSLRPLLEKGLVIKKKFGIKGKEKCYFSLLIEETERDKIYDDDDISEEEMDLISNNSYQCPKDTTPVSQRHYPSVLKTPTKETTQKKSSKEESRAYLLTTREGEGRKEASQKEIEFRNGRFEGISESQMQAWKRAYPEINIDASLAQFEVYLQMNPKSINSTTPWVVRINSWISKQDSSKVKEEVKKEDTNPEKEIEKEKTETEYFYSGTARRFVEEWSEKLGMKGVISFCSNILCIKIFSTNKCLSYPIYEKKIVQFMEMAKQEIMKELQTTQT